jgi:hypothetical protein
MRATPCPYHDNQHKREVTTISRPDYRGSPRIPYAPFSPSFSNAGRLQRSRRLSSIPEVASTRDRYETLDADVCNANASLVIVVLAFPISSLFPQVRISSTKSSQTQRDATTRQRRHDDDIPSTRYIFVRYLTLAPLVCSLPLQYLYFSKYP